MNTVTMALLRIFPHLLKIYFIEKKWKDAVKILLSNIMPGNALDVGDPQE